jgi:hypothetical protein
MNLDEAVERFERRSRVLTRQAWLFLLLVVLLLAAGAAAVWFAPSITASDIGSTTYEKKLAAIKAASEKDAARLKTLVPESEPARTICREAIRTLLQRWLRSEDVSGLPYLYTDAEAPTGDSLLEGMQPAFQRMRARPSDKTMYAAFTVAVCNSANSRTQYNLEVPRDDLPQLENVLKGKTFAPPALLAALEEQKSLEAREKRLNALSEQVGLERLQSEVGGVNEAPAPTNLGKDDLFIRLIQTSITRFGLLAVVGFFVSILVSLYRYNVRLAAFYMARADVLRLYAPNIAISDFALMAGVLSPTVEFGKTPQPPLGQLVEMAKTMKEAGK